MRSEPTPMKRAACTYSRSRSEVASDQITRALNIQPNEGQHEDQHHPVAAGPCETSARMRNEGTTSRKWMNSSITRSAMPPK